jgi:hypothetical protein
MSQAKCLAHQGVSGGWLAARFLTHPIREAHHLIHRGVEVRFRVLFRMLTAGLAVLVASLPAYSVSDPAAVASSDPAATGIVIGFLGGFVRHDDLRHGPVQLAQRLQRTFPKGTHVETFENRHRAQARAAVRRLLDTNHDGVLSDEEKSRARIVLYGHSWGAAAAVLLARELRRDHIPVLLTVQVDSIPKFWQKDSVIPDNVAAAVNFYQPHGVLHGRARITAADPSKTEILGNYRTDYKKDPIPCPEASWSDRFFTPGHMQSECDPRLWSRVEDLVRQHITGQDVASALGQKQ